MRGALSHRWSNMDWHLSYQNRRLADENGLMPVSKAADSTLPGIDLNRSGDLAEVMNVLWILTDD